MKLVTQVKLVPDAVQAPVFERTLPAVNEAANRVSAVSSLPNTARGNPTWCSGRLPPSS
ncbi:MULTISPECIES: hypothetical protein [Streptomyces]|uniref:hypothetical protein n=1 Tax=Streptomyces TaxID=1883 RepID=UPI00163C5E66|nr:MULTISPECIES: hypothetical protein [unclassified Streptomyces]QTI91093.1 hypothetical protein AS97_47540 [Streptomyces sp. AgN23]